MCEPRNRDNGASDVWALTAYTWHIMIIRYQFKEWRTLLSKNGLQMESYINIKSNFIKESLKPQDSFGKKDKTFS